MADSFIFDAVRTPVGRHGGALAGIRPDDLAATVLAALERTWTDSSTRPGPISSSNAPRVLTCDCPAD